MSLRAGREGAAVEISYFEGKTLPAGTGKAKVSPTKNVILFTGFWLHALAGHAAKGHGRWLLC